MKKIIIGIVVVLIILYIGRIDTKDPFQKGISDKILRFHVLANSDSSEDQEVKLKVRDAVGSYVETLLANAASRSETESILNENMDRIIELAENTLAANGKNYGATARIINTEFPEKTYGKYTFPSGKYEALQIRLGEAKGHNWWCVLYPNLCFRGAMYEEVDDEADDELREILSPEEYKDVIDSGNFEVKFKLLEYLSLTR